MLYRVYLAMSWIRYHNVNCDRHIRKIYILCFVHFCHSIILDRSQTFSISFYTMYILFLSTLFKCIFYISYFNIKHSWLKKNFRVVLINYETKLKRNERNEAKRNITQRNILKCETKRNEAKYIQMRSETQRNEIKCILKCETQRNILKCKTKRKYTKIQ